MNVDVFISHHTNSSLHIVEAIVNRLESNGIRCWYAPRDTQGAYASSIMDAIDGCSIFLLILNKPSSESVHVLNELDLATKRLSRKENIRIIPFHTADEDISKDAQYYLGRLHWIDATKPSMIERINELVKEISPLVLKTPMVDADTDTSAKSHTLISKIPQTRNVFEGREDLLQSIRTYFENGERILFLEGIGGIGKSELAKQYAISSRDRYRYIIFVSYTDNLISLVCDPHRIEISNFEKRPDETKEELFLRKMKEFRSVAGKNTLLIVDNYDVDNDPHFELFIEGSHDIIFTTRNVHSGYRSINVGAIDSMEVLFEIFEKNYGSPLCEENKPYLEKLFSLVENHTYAIELLAKQMEASFYTVEELYNVFRNGYNSSETDEQIAGREGMNTAIGHIRSLFSLSNLCSEKRQILRELALTGTTGIPAKTFFEWTNPTQNGTAKQHMNQLISQSWVRCERKLSYQQLTLHPLVAEVIIGTSELRPDVVNCRHFLEKMADRLYFTWNNPLKENILYSDAVLSIAEYFVPFNFEKSDPELFEIWCVISNYLWQIGRFEKSIRYGTIVYQTCLDVCGFESMLTGHAARELAGAYFNSRYVEESIPWYHIALEHMKAVTDEDSIDLAVAYEKVARTYTWEWNQDFDKAYELFKKAIEIRFCLIDAYESGINIKRIQHRYEANAQKTREGLSNIYMELGRMCQKTGDYEMALHHAQKYLTMMMEYGSKNVSNRTYAVYDIGICKYHLALEAQECGETERSVILFEEARKLLIESLENNLKMRGNVAMDTIDNQEAIGDVYAAMNRYGEAANCYLATISMLEKLFGSDYERIGNVQKKMEKLG